ncbi:hypothetical protein JMJ35_010316 [Cladonia borealis]|uniref:Uncharacterized protein n=1 Tax=Cladonia borealis TaxID=184061 RepID=A0AA39QT71_9LECA|nr:hypothetical protein JMJ35_010316 [Cladonia borealis]
MAAIPIPKVLANSRVAPPADVVTLENVLQSIDFTKQVTAWASQTGAGNATYSGVGVVRDLPLAKTKQLTITPRSAQIVATTSCEKTPTATSFTSWTCTDALTWTYTTATKQQILVKMEPRDMLRRLALVGSCVATEPGDTAPGKPVSSRHFTLGPILRQRPPQGATAEIKWTVLVFHAFGTNAELGVDESQQGVSRHDSWKTKVCSGLQSDPAAQCTKCMAEDCIMCTPSVQWAAGQHDVVRSMSWDIDMSLVRSPQQPTPPIVPLDINEFIAKASALMIDDLTDSSMPVIISIAVECVAQKAQLNPENDGQPDVQYAGADFYSTTLKKDQALGDDVTLPGMAGCADDDLYF